MNDTKERLKELRKALNLNQTEFAKRINRSQGVFSQYEIGVRELNDRTITDICREFNVNEGWLRTGEGVMFNPPKDTDTELSEAIADLIVSDDEFTKRLILAYVKLPKEHREAFKNFIGGVMKEEE